MQHLLSRHLMGGLIFQMHEALLWNKKALSGKFQESILWKVVNFPPTILLQALLGFLAACPIGPRSSHWGGVPQVQVGLAHKHRETQGTRKHGNSGTGTQRSRSPRTRAAPARGLEPPHLVMKNHLVRRKGEKKTSKRGTKNNLVMKNHLMRRKGELTSRRGTKM